MFKFFFFFKRCFLKLFPYWNKQKQSFCNISPNNAKSLTKLSKITTQTNQSTNPVKKRNRSAWAQEYDQRPEVIQYKHQYYLANQENTMNLKDKNNN